MRYVAIRSEGGLIPYDLLDKIASEDAAGQKPGDFGLPKGRRLTDEISRVWADAQSLWSNFKRRRESLGDRDPYGTSITRSWIGSLLGDVDMLGFDLKLQASAVVVNNSTYAISHRSGEGEDAIPVHIEGLKIDLDRRLHTKLRTSPQAMVQDFLNNNEPTVWGIVTNGLGLRILRNSSRTSRPTYLEFDLENIFDGNRFNEFGLFYRVCHRSRFPMAGRDLAECLLEKYYLDSIEQGLRVRDKLREGVEETLKILGSAFLQHPENDGLREKVSSGKLTAVQFHRQLLLLVYRLLFLMVAEERGLIVSVGENAEQNQKIYDEWYSITRLRDRAAQIIDTSPFGDLWQGLQQTFSLFEYGLDTNALGIPPLNGDLFHQEHAIPNLKGTKTYNHELLRAIRHLSLFKDGNVQQRVNYSALDVEELGSVYESLLDYQPVLQPGDKGLVFELRTGAERKSTGSYYTRPELVHELVESALVPVMEYHIAEAEKASEGKNLVEEQKAKIATILNLTVCDPACGSGHFLLAAARRLGKELARIRTGEDEPRPEDFHLAVRDVISHCVYGVDLNPLAVDLCKLALWLEGHWAGKPLSFLDHRIRCGNSLVGVFSPEEMAEGIPDDAFTAVTGDDKKVATTFKRRNREERTSKQRGFSFDADDHTDEYAKMKRELSELREDTAAAVRHKADLYSGWRAGMQLSHDEAVADLWTAQFFMFLTKTDDPAVCTTGPFLDFSHDAAKQPQKVAAAQAAASQNRFFHWHLEFPEVFEKGGFHAVLGNPPWEKIKLQEREFFESRSPRIAHAQTASERRKLMDALKESAEPEDRALYSEYLSALRSHEGEMKAARFSGRYRYTGQGDLNTYALFGELSAALTAPKGRVGVILKTGIATDDTMKDFFGYLVEKRRLVSLVDFANKRGIFPAVIANERFCLVTLAGENNGPKAFSVSVLNETVEGCRDPERTYELTLEDVTRINPNTKTCPLFHGREDAVVCRAIYARNPVLLNESTVPEDNPWGIRYHRMFDMTNDSGIFRDREWLLDNGYSLHGNVFSKDGNRYLPLYEGKLLNLFNHRHGTFEGIPRSDRFGIKAEPNHPNVMQLRDTDYEVEPRYWVPEADVTEEYERKGIPRDVVFLFRDVCRAFTDSRTARGTLVPWCAAGNKAPLLIFQGSSSEERARRMVLFASIFGSFTFDFVVRQKLSSASLNRFILMQICAPLPRAFESEYGNGGTIDSLGNWIMKFGPALFCNTKALVPLFMHLGETKPVEWDPATRQKTICLVDALVARAYGLSRGQYEYILTRFPILRSQETEKYGEWLSQRLCLEGWDGFREA